MRGKKARLIRKFTQPPTNGALYRAVYSKDGKVPHRSTKVAVKDDKGTVVGFVNKRIPYQKKGEAVPFLCTHPNRQLYQNMKKGFRKSPLRTIKRAGDALLQIAKSQRENFKPTPTHAAREAGLMARAKAKLAGMIRFMA